MPPLMYFRRLYIRQPISLFLAVFGLFLAIVTGCGVRQPENGGAPTLEVRGQIIEVVARNIAEVESLRIRDESEREFIFTTDQTGEFVGFTPSHLKEHQLSGQTILVSYVERESRLVAVKISD